VSFEATTKDPRGVVRRGASAGMGMLWMLPGMPKWRWGTSFISVSMASIRDTAKMLAMMPPAVASIARITVNQTAYSPSAGRAAAASE
jgi:ABC-type polysaccharide/polyol phosphate export permease